MTCIKMGSDESHFNVSLMVKDKVTRPCPQTTIFWRERRAEAVSNRGPSAYHSTALPLGQTGSKNYAQKCAWNLFSRECLSCTEFVVDWEPVQRMKQKNDITSYWNIKMALIAAHLNAGIILVVTVYSDRCIISLFPHLYTPFPPSPRP